MLHAIYEKHLIFHLAMHHHYKTIIEWADSSGTTDYRSYSRNHTVQVEGKPLLLCSSDPAFRGDISRYNPEELFIASIASCHFLWYLHLCADAGIIVQAYNDAAVGIMKENPDGSGEFTEITLYPHITVLHDSMKEKALALHEQAHRMCFLARSVRFPVLHKPTINVHE